MRSLAKTLADLPSSRAFWDRVSSSSDGTRIESTLVAGRTRRISAGVPRSQAACKSRSFVVMSASFSLRAVLRVRRNERGNAVPDASLRIDGRQRDEDNSRRIALQLSPDHDAHAVLGILVPMRVGVLGVDDLLHFPLGEVVFLPQLLHDLGREAHFADFRHAPSSSVYMMYT